MNKTISLVILLTFIMYGTSLFSQNIQNNDYKFSLNPGKDWKQRSVIETNKKDVITYSLDKKDGRQSLSIIAFKLTAPKKLDDFIYTIEKDFNLNIPEKVSDYEDFNGTNYEGKTADYSDKESIEKLYYIVTSANSSGEYYCYLIRFVGEEKLPRDIFNGDVKLIAQTFKINI